ncbi:ABC transporter ATP-binding protein [Desulfotalea psychrophila]|uniref:Probable lipoprotein releasing system, ATP-binding protein (LolD) n=1 Tax=Desulfotalea psychrophila (strain LSv54 / DSM 12343) TaxID=177439 RepID=Q6AMB2_DESPS|nr:ABC transporter ATP-binding protein [Desulfotalea psychrophila]CAG36513.1 probable lipoprotein releasing system, ATP-binding protein (LolD) [Desulfotalea psychrophila LSv54]
MDNSNIITINGLTKKFPIGDREFTALSNVTLSFTRGEFTGLVGPSGSGKTTLLNIIGSLDIPTKGSATVLGHSIKELSHSQASQLRNKSLGFIFQTYNLLPVYTVFENVEFPLLLLKTPARERNKMVLQALEAVGLTDKAQSRPSQLSGGESQRVAIARAMVKSPEIVLADEPTANLDAKNSHHILQTMVKLNREFNTTFIFASHDEKVIGYLRRKISLDDGRVVADEYIERPVHLARMETNYGGEMPCSL